MKFRIRPPFRMFPSFDAAATFEATGSKSGVRPINAGRVVNLTPEQASGVLCRGDLGKLEPICDEAKRFYGNTPPAVPDTETNPSLYAIRPEPARAEFRMEAVR